MVPDDVDPELARMAADVVRRKIKMAEAERLMADAHRSAKIARRLAVAAVIVNALNIAFVVTCTVLRHYYPEHPFFTREVVTFSLP